MPKLAEKNNCTGCTACASICPQQCICMEEDTEGFRYPKIINSTLCISCSACEQVCPVLNNMQISVSLNKAYSAMGKDDSIRLKSSSGGIFSELAKVILMSGGIVYGASYNDNGLVEHIGVNNINTLKKLCGAKYSQSNLGECFQLLKKQLLSGREVVFSGTPCQVAGLKSFLKKDYANLFCIDFVCHSVPSPMVWKEYVKYRAKIDNGGIAPQYINLRNKESGWSKYSYSVEFNYLNDKRYLCNNNNDPYMYLFVNDYISRESCSSCHFKGYDRVSDITLGDFWGIWNIDPEMDDNKGTSLVLIHSAKGEKLFKSVIKNIRYKQVTLEQASAMNQSILYSSPHKPNRDQLLSMIERDGFQVVVPAIMPKIQRRKKTLRSKIRNLLRLDEQQYNSSHNF